MYVRTCAVWHVTVAYAVLWRFRPLHTEAAADKKVMVSLTTSAQIRYVRYSNYLFIWIGSGDVIGSMSTLPGTSEHVRTRTISVSVWQHF